MTNERKPRERHYASKAKVRQYVEVARELGIEVGGFEVTADGVIRVMSVQGLQKPEPPNAYDLWVAQEEADRRREKAR